MLVFLAKQLQAQGFDGLYCQSGDGCACLLTDLSPLDCVNAECHPGVIVKGWQPECANGDCEFHVMAPTAMAVR